MAFTKIVPNLVVTDVQRSVAFYCDVLGFEMVMNVPDAPPFVFASVKRDEVEIFLNEVNTVVQEYPPFKDKPLGGTLTLFTHITGIAEYHESVRAKTAILMPLEKKWYGVWEFAVADPDGYILTFAQQEDG